jgi:hypothetical protein
MAHIKICLSAIIIAFFCAEVSENNFLVIIKNTCKTVKSKNNYLIWQIAQSKQLKTDPLRNELRKFSNFKQQSKGSFVL